MSSGSPDTTVIAVGPRVRSCARWRRRAWLRRPRGSRRRRRRRRSGAPSSHRLHHITARRTSHRGADPRHPGRRASATGGRAPCGGLVRPWSPARWAGRRRSARVRRRPRGPVAPSGRRPDRAHDRGRRGRARRDQKGRRRVHERQVSGVPVAITGLPTAIAGREVEAETLAAVERDEAVTQLDERLHAMSIEVAILTRNRAVPRRLSHTIELDGPRRAVDRFQDQRGAVVGSERRAVIRVDELQWVLARHHGVEVVDEEEHEAIRRQTQLFPVKWCRRARAQTGSGTVCTGTGDTAATTRS